MMSGSACEPLGEILCSCTIVLEVAGCIAECKHFCLCAGDNAGSLTTENPEMRMKAALAAALQDAGMVGTEATKLLAVRAAAESFL